VRSGGDAEETRRDEQVAPGSIVLLIISNSLT
jgi:hypothetical protein